MEFQQLALRRAATLLLAMAMAGCGGGSPTQPSQSNNGGSGPPQQQPPPQGGGPTLQAGVDVSDNTFSPSAVTVLVNGTVTWTWSGGGYGLAHNVTFTDADSGDKTSGTYSRQFTTAGKFTYKCTNHPQTMSGTVTVQ